MRLTKQDRHFNLEGMNRDELSALTLILRRYKRYVLEQSLNEHAFIEAYEKLAIKEVI